MAVSSSASHAEGDSKASACLPLAVALLGLHKGLQMLLLLGRHHPQALRTCGAGTQSEADFPKTFALPQGSFGPFGPKVANIEFENGFPAERVPGPFRPQGPKSPKQS